METEKTIQNTLFGYRYQAGCQMVVPNIFLYRSGESDLVSVSKAGLVSEYEIKISKADFLREFRAKKFKHEKLDGGNKRILAKSKCFYQDNPNYYYFAVPCHMQEYVEQRTPGYAGIIIIDNGRVFIAKKAPRIHSRKITDQQIGRLERGLMIRYWRSRDVTCF